jgi:hypothetical protein
MERMKTTEAPRPAAWRGLSSHLPATAAVCVLAASLGCRADEGGGQLHAKRVVLQREVKGLREAVGKLEGGERIFPEDALLISIAEGVVKQFVDAQLPFTIELERFRIELKAATATFRGSPTVSLTGTIIPKEHPDYVGEVSAIAVLETIEVETATGTLRANLAVEHVDLLKMAGLERLLAGGTVDELARSVRLQLKGRLPEIKIPVKIEQSIELPAVTDGPVRLQGATMPLAVSVTDVLAGQGVLWIAIRVVPGELVEASS